MGYMLLADYDRLPNFTAQEVVNTGGDPERMECAQMVGIQRVRTIINRRIKLLHNGMNSGVHTSKLNVHEKGRASDFELSTKDGAIDQAAIYAVFTAAITCGFNGIGVYFNGVGWSFHLDRREVAAFWIGRKAKPGAKGWTYRRMQIGCPSN